MTIAVEIRRTLPVRTVARSVCVVVVAGSTTLAHARVSDRNATTASATWVFVSRGPSSKPSIIGQIVAVSESEL